MPHSGRAAERHWWDSARVRHAGGIGALQLLMRLEGLRLESLQMAVGVLVCDELPMCLAEGIHRALPVRFAGSGHTGEHRCEYIFALRFDTTRMPRDSSSSVIIEIDGFG